MSRFFLFSVILGNFLGISIAWIDSSPHWDDAGISALLVLSAAFLCGFLGDRRTWIIALSVGIWIPLSGILTNHNFGSLLALIPAFIGAYLGHFTGKMIWNHTNL